MYLLNVINVLINLWKREVDTIKDEKIGPKDGVIRFYSKGHLNYYRGKTMP